MADAAIELGRAHKLTLINGTELRVIFSLYTLAVIEDELGSIDEINKAFAAGSKGKLIRTVAKMLAAAIVDETGEPVEMEENKLLKQISLTQVAIVIEAVKKGLIEAFHGPQAETETPIPAVKTENHSDSLGAPSSTGGSSSHDNHVESSGD